MKLLITGDWHLDYKQPKNRIDDCPNAQKEKMKWIFRLAHEKEVDAILQPGDFFNSHKMPDHVKVYWMKFFKYWNIPIYTVPGQHDMRYHSSDLKDTPMGVLEAAGVLKILRKNPHKLDEKTVYIYGAGWEQDIPSPEPKGFPEIGHNVLVMHKMVSDKSLWPGHQFTTPIWLLENTKFDLIVTGDNHKHFTHEREIRAKYTEHKASIIDNRILINCGSLMRSSIDQEDHEPIVYIYDTDKREIKGHNVPIKPFEEVMNLEKVQEEKKRNEELEVFIDGLHEANVKGLDFKKNLIDHLNDNKGKIADAVINLINKLVQ